MPICVLKKNKEKCALQLLVYSKTVWKPCWETSTVVHHWASWHLALTKPRTAICKKKTQINSWYILLHFFYHLFNFRCTFNLRHSQSNSPLIRQDGPVILPTPIFSLLWFKLLPCFYSALKFSLIIWLLFLCLLIYHCFLVKKKYYAITLLLLAFHPLFHHEIYWIHCQFAFLNLLFWMLCKSAFHKLCLPTPSNVILMSINSLLCLLSLIILLPCPNSLSNCFVDMEYMILHSFAVLWQLQL